MDKLKLNYDLLDAQRREYNRNGILLRNIFSISSRHPLLSIVFVLVFGVLTNALFELASLFLAKSDYTLLRLSLLIAAFVAVLGAIYGWVRWLHRDRFTDVPIYQRKVLVSLVSPRDGGSYEDTPTFAVLKALLYGKAGQPAPNALEKVVLVSSESKESLETAKSLKQHVEEGGRQAEVYGVSIEGKTISEIQKQLTTLFQTVFPNYKPVDVVADYTGGNKEMSVALLKASEKELILPIYLNEAKLGRRPRKTKPAK